MDDLKKVREKINEIDQQMAKLFEDRMIECKKVANYKIINSLPVCDANREKEILKNNVNYINDETIKKYYLSYMQSVMNISKDYQKQLMKGMKVAYSGTKGAYAYFASKKIFDSQKLVAYSSFKKAYQSVEEGKCDACILPIENSYAGDVGEVMDLMFSGDLYINKVIDVDILHNLIALNNASMTDIKTVMSHPQALNQCQDFIDKHHLKKIEYSNTALAAKKLIELNDKSIAIIASEDVALTYKLPILARNINTTHNNTTRFAVFSRVLGNYQSNERNNKHFIITFTVKNEAGSLAKTLDIIGAHGFNMRTLRSRPMKELIWNYYFFVELDGDVYSQDGIDMLAQLKSLCKCLKIVGVYTSNNEK
ncbi:MAG: chorismate mutase [Erysipelotrichaceae bacterium]|nr:chorismate mutase [Erysipelotrichaceae bacterium]